jgi:hypothetical protein
MLILPKALPWAAIKRTFGALKMRLPATGKTEKSLALITRIPVIPEQ